MTTAENKTPAVGETAGDKNNTESVATLFEQSKSDNCCVLYNPAFVSGRGQYHTNEPGKEKRTPYLSVTLAAIREMVDNPPSVPKAKGRWFIPSTLLSRTFATQEESGEFGMLWADMDEDPKPLSDVCDCVATEIIGYCDVEVYASRSAREDYQKGRVLVPLLYPLSGADWLLCQKILNDKLAAYGMIPDRKSEGCGQLCYLPNRGDFYDAHTWRNGAFFDPLTEWADEIEAARKAAPPPRKASGPISATSNDEMVDYLNAGHWSANGESSDGRKIYVECPNAEQHTTDTGISSTAWFRAGTNGYAQGHFECLHSHCQHIDTPTFKRMIGFDMHGFEVVAPQAAALIERAKTAPTPVDLNTLFSDLILTDKDVAEMADAEFLIDNLIVRSSLHAFVAPANGGKTTLFIYLCEELATRGLKIFYINADASPPDLKRHQAHASKHRYAVLAPDAKAGKGPKDVVGKLKALNESNTDLNDVVIILDTLKKFTTMLDKSRMSGFLALMRGLSSKGATVILLAHTNKRTEDDGKHIFEGTGDLRNDVDNLIYLESSKNESEKKQEITTRPDKVRAEFKPVSYAIDFNDNRKVSKCGSVLPVLDADARAVKEAAEAILQARGQVNQTVLVKYIKEQLPDVGEKKIRSKLLNLARNRIFNVTPGESNAALYSLAGCVDNTANDFDDLSDHGGDGK